MVHEIQKAVREWLAGISAQYGARLEIAVTHDEPGRYLVNIDNSKYLGEITVSRLDFRPFRYVSFYVLDKDGDPRQNPAFVYFDSEHDTLPEIIRHLDEGVAFLLKSEEHA